MQQKIPIPWMLILLGIVFFIPFLGNVHLFDWDEINFAESSREMIVSGNYSRVMIGFKPFWEKPPLFFWMQAGAMHVFGVNEFAARLPNAIFGVISLLTLFYMGKKERDEQFGLIWALMYLASILPHMYFKSGIIDPVFNYFIFTGIYFIYRTLETDKDGIRYAAYAGVLIGVAVLTKGPVGLLIPILAFVAMVIINKFRLLPSLREFLLLALMVLITSSAWYGMEIVNNGPWFLVEFLKYQVELFSKPVADHQQPFYYHFVVVLIGCFPMSVFALGSFSKKSITDRFAQWMMVLFWTVMILFTIVTTKIVHYSSLAYLPLSFLATSYLVEKTRSKKALPGWMLAFYLFLGGVFGILLTALPLVGNFKEKLIPYINDPFAVAGLVKPVAWNGFEFLFGTMFLLAVVISFIYLRQKNFFNGLVTMVIGTGFVLSSYMVFVLPKIEDHTQGSLIDFMVGLQGKDVYVTTYGFHSYAKYFYFRQPNNNLEQRADQGYLLNGEIDKPVYIITKITDKSLVARTDLDLIKEEGGFRFYLRNP